MYDVYGYAGGIHVHVGTHSLSTAVKQVNQFLIVKLQNRSGVGRCVSQRPQN